MVIVLAVKLLAIKLLAVKLLTIKFPAVKNRWPQPGSVGSALNRPPIDGLAN